MLGLPLALLATRVIRQQMFGLDPLDPLTFALALLVIAGTTFVAAWLPARRAANVDPVAALRCE